MIFLWLFVDLICFLFLFFAEENLSVNLQSRNFALFNGRGDSSFFIFILFFLFCRYLDWRWNTRNDFVVWLFCCTVERFWSFLSDSIDWSFDWLIDWLIVLHPLAFSNNKWILWSLLWFLQIHYCLLRRDWLIDFSSNFNTFIYVSVFSYNARMLLS